MRTARGGSERPEVGNAAPLVVVHAEVRLDVRITDREPELALVVERLEGRRQRTEVVELRGVAADTGRPLRVAKRAEEPRHILHQRPADDERERQARQREADRGPLRSDRSGNARQAQEAGVEDPETARAHLHPRQLVSPLAPAEQELLRDMERTGADQQP